MAKKNLIQTQLSFLKDLFPCNSAVCKSCGEVAYKVTTTFFPHGKLLPRAWTNVEYLCQDCADRLRKQMQSNPFIAEYNDIKIEAL